MSDTFPAEIPTGTALAEVLAQPADAPVGMHTRKACERWLIRTCRDLWVGPRRHRCAWVAPLSHCGLSASG